MIDIECPGIGFQVQVICTFTVEQTTGKSTCVGGIDEANLVYIADGINKTNTCLTSRNEFGLYAMFFQSSV